MWSSVVLPIALLLLAAHFINSIARGLAMPRVTFLLLLGLALGNSSIALFSDIPQAIVSFCTVLSLSMVGFLLGENFQWQALKQSGVAVLAISVGESVLCAVVVFIAVWLVTGDLVLALLLAGIAPATDPAATLDVVKQYQIKTALSDMLVKVVAIDDVWGILLFSLALVLAMMVHGQSAATVPSAEHSVALTVLHDIAGGIALGAVLGLVMAQVTGRVKPGEPTLLEAIAFILLLAALADLLKVSYLIASVTMGALVANFAKHHIKAFRDIEGSSEPFLVVFFVLAGLQLQLQSLGTVWVILLVYLFARSAGLIWGGRLGAVWSHSTPTIAKHIGGCLLPQAGVALGLALMVQQQFPEVGDKLLAVVLASTICFELIGPLLTKYHLLKGQSEHVVGDSTR